MNASECRLKGGERILMAALFDLAEVTFMKRVVIGNTNPEQLQDDSAIEKQMAFLNRCLNDYPKGKIIGQEKSFHILRIGEHQVVMQYVVYHVGFMRFPSWMDDPAVLGTPQAENPSALFDYNKLPPELRPNSYSGGM